MSDAVKESDLFDFLVDVVPRDGAAAPDAPAAAASGKTKRSGTTGGGAAAAGGKAGSKKRKQEESEEDGSFTPPYHIISHTDHTGCGCVFVHRLMMIRVFCVCADD